VPALTTFTYPNECGLSIRSLASGVGSTFRGSFHGAVFDGTELTDSRKLEIDFKVVRTE
jgi:hypothetical protein